MSTLEDLDDLNNRDQDDKKRDDEGDKDKGKDGKAPSSGNNGDTDMKDAQPEEDDVLDEEILSLGSQDIRTRKRLLENDSRIMRSEVQHLTHEKATMNEKIKDNNDKIANNRYILLVSRRELGSFRADYLSLGNYRTLSATSLNSSTSTRQQNPQKRVPTSTWTRRAWASLP